MFSLLATSFFSSSPIAKWVKDHLLYIVLALIAAASLTYLVYDFVSTKHEVLVLQKQLVTESAEKAKMQVVIDTQIATIGSLNKELELIKKSNQATNDSEKEIHDAVIDSNNKHDQRQKRLGKHIRDITNDNSKSDTAKAEEISLSLATDLMVGWCGEHISSSPEVCKLYPDTPQDAQASPAPTGDAPVDSPQPTPVSADPQGE